MSKLTAADLRKHFEKRMEDLRQEQIEGSEEVGKCSLLREALPSSKSVLRIATGIRCRCEPGTSVAHFKRGTETMALPIAESASRMLNQLSDGQNHVLESLPCDDPLERVFVCQVLIKKGCLEFASEAKGQGKGKTDGGYPGR
eukprot:TRINITY_DN9779_c0_g1_i3.p1 TRINITY_DN9779_c0_g1~~TRINITY_DN9779_c0_g1_i3.p1  ORF type:complete len:143 (+),score=30.68 TRINITY_DN9779_c0_g1_i3:195-623(+)